MSKDATYNTEGFLLTECSALLPPVGGRGKSAYTTSRLAVLRNGTTAPVLRLLAERKFSSWDEAERFPYWADGDHTNELLSNVELATRMGAGSPRSKKGRLGAPAGSREYMRLWQKANKDKVAAAQRRYRAKRDALLATLQAKPEHASLAAELTNALEASTTEERSIVLTRLEEAVRGT
jgi:hypothetical protein